MIQRDKAEFCSGLSVEAVNTSPLPGFNPCSPDFSSDEQLQVESIIGMDDRTRVFDVRMNPYKHICLLHLETRYGLLMMGSGALISPTTVLTAGHCVYNHNVRYGTGPMRVKDVFIGRNEQRWRRRAEADRVVVPEKWANWQQKESDYGVIKLTEPVLRGCLQYAEVEQSEAQGLKVSVIGYPADKNERVMGRMYGHTNKITIVEPQRFGYQIDTVGGDSGAPVIYHSRDEGFFVVGIHNYGGLKHNYATRINAEVFDWISKQLQSTAEAGTGNIVF